MINGYINESNGGSFGAGWWGGQVSGFVSAIPGIVVPLGAFVGSVTTDCIDYGWDGIDLNKALVTSLIACGASLFPTMIGEFASKYKIYDKVICGTKSMIPLIEDSIEEQHRSRLSPCQMTVSLQKEISK